MAQSSDLVEKKKTGLWNISIPWNISISILIFALVFFIFSGTIANIDLWGHLKVGLDNLANKQIVRVDTYSYLTQGQQWINHEWLSQILLAVAWLAGKVSGLIVLKMLISLATVGVVYWNYYLQRIDIVISGLLIFVGSILLASDFPTIYPEIFTLLLYALMLFLILRAEEGQLKWLWFAPLIFLFWTNLHGGFLAGLGIFFLWTLFHLGLKWEDWKSVALPLGASFLVTLINPSGVTLYEYLLRSSNDARPEISVYTSISLTSPFGIIFVFVVAISIVGFIFTRRYRSAPLIILFGLSAFMPFVAKRYLAIFALTAMMFAGEHVADLLLQYNGLRAFTQKRTTAKAISALVLAILLIFLSIPNLTGIAVSQSPPNPVQAVQIIKNSQVKGNLAVEYNWGGYIMWHLGPDVKVSVDGRRETVYSPEIYQENLSFLLGLGNWDAILKNHPTDMVLVNDHSPVFNLMKSAPGWDLIYQDEAGALYVRSGSDLEAPLKKAAQAYVPILDNGYFP